MNDLENALAEFQAALPGWWWSVGSCRISGDASCGPDRGGVDKSLLSSIKFDSGFHVYLKGGTPAEALRAVTHEASVARMRAWHMTASEYEAALVEVASLMCQREGGGGFDYLMRQSEVGDRLDYLSYVVQLYENVNFPMLEPATNNVKEIYRKPDQGIVDILTRALEKAKRGEINNVVLVAELASDNAFYHASNMADGWRTLGAIEYARAGVFARLTEGGRNDR
jgi:hypothetical protein